jgi:subtilisin family serine protease
MIRNIWLALTHLVLLSASNLFLLCAQDLPPVRGSDTASPGRISPALAELIAVRDPAQRQKAARAAHMSVRQGLIEVEVQLELGATWNAALLRSTYGVETVHESREHNIVWARVPPENLANLVEREPAIRFVTRPPVGVAQGTVTQGLQLTEALKNFHEQGFKGAGVKVAVIDLGFNRLTNAQQEGELPSTLVTKDFSGDGLAVGPDGQPESHGVAVAEIIHDMAPEAELHLLKAASPAQIKEAIDYCVANGIKIINHSVGYFNTSLYDGTGPVNEVVGSARDQGILWINSAGNYARQHYQGAFFDSDQDVWHNFEARDETIDMRLSRGQSITVYLSWSAWRALDGDYELYILDDSLDVSKPLAKSEPRQQGDTQPARTVSATATKDGTYHIAIRRAAGTRSHVLALFVHGADLGEYRMAERSIVDPASSERVLAVGAIDQEEWTNGRIENYSSQGPTNGGLMKPDLCGPDKVKTLTSDAIVVVGYGLLPDDACIHCFPGTSAASPHVAGAAALLMSRDPGLNVHDLRLILEASAASYGGDRRNNHCGAGRLNLAAELPRPAPRVTSSVRLVQPGPYFPGQRVTAEFTITNRGRGCITFASLTVGGRGPDSQVIDFPWHWNITLCEGESYTYRGTIILGGLGPHHFFAAYRAVDGQWNTSVETDSASNTVNLSVSPAPMILYGIDGAAGNSRTRLLRIEQRNGVAVVVGETTLRPITDIAFTPDGGLYGISEDRLYRINPLTAASVEVGPLRVRGANALVSDPSGRLIAATTEGQILSVDRFSGEAAVIGTLGGTLRSSGDLAFSSDGTLYGTVEGAQSDLLIRIDLSTGRGTTIGQIGFRSVYGLAFDANGTLLGGVNGGTQPSQLIRISMSTGIGQVIGVITNANGLFGLSFGREPQAWTIYRDDLEGDVSTWFRERPWAVTEERSRSPRRAWSDSPNGNYADDVNVAVVSRVLDLSASNGATLRFWHQFDVEQDYDFCQVWISTDFGSTWERVARFTGLTRNWIQSTVDLTKYVSSAGVRLGFQLVSDRSITGDGWYIDDIEVVGAR